MSDAKRERPVANKAKSSKGAEKDRRARVEAMRKEQLAKERRKTTIIVALAVVAAGAFSVGALLTLPGHIDKIARTVV